LLPRFAAQQCTQIKDCTTKDLMVCFWREVVILHYVVDFCITIESSRSRHSNGGMLAVICDDVVCRKGAKDGRLWRIGAIWPRVVRSVLVQIYGGIGPSLFLPKIVENRRIFLCAIFYLGCWWEKTDHQVFGLQYSLN